MIFDAFHFYCQKVLPAVYDESLSYYEVVCKLVKAMQTLDESMADLEQRMDVLDRISTELWPQFQAEVNATLQQYAKAYEDFQAGIERDISKFETDLETMNTNLANAIKDQNDAIAAANAAQVAMLTERLAQQDVNISNIQSTVQQNSQDMADLTADVHDFIAQYSPPATINGLSPQFIITANAGATIMAVQGLIELNATADSEGKAVINVSNYGDWAVTATYQGQTKTVTVSVDDVKQYAVNVEQAEKTYTFVLNPIPNFADLPSIITQSMFQVTGPNGYSTTKPVQATAQSFSVPGPGEYSFDLKIANIYPDASSETGYKAASASGAVIYTSTPGGVVVGVMPDTMTNNSYTVTPLSLPYFNATLPNDKQLAVTSPVTATDVTQTMVGVSTEYKFVPWVNGTWEMSSSAVPKNTYNVTSDVWQNPRQIIRRLSPYVIPNLESFVWPFRTQASTNVGSDATDGDVEDATQKRNEALTKFKITPVGINSNAKIIGELTTINSYQSFYDTGSLFDKGNDYAGVLIPSFTYSLEGDNIRIGDGTDIFPLFYSPDGTHHDGVVVLSQALYYKDNSFYVSPGLGGLGGSNAEAPLPAANTEIQGTAFHPISGDLLLFAALLYSIFSSCSYKFQLIWFNNIVNHFTYPTQIVSSEVRVGAIIPYQYCVVKNEPSNKPGFPAFVLPKPTSMDNVLDFDGYNYSINPDLKGLFAWLNPSTINRYSLNGMGSGTSTSMLLSRLNIYGTSMQSSTRLGAMAWVDNIG